MKAESGRGKKGVRNTPNNTEREEGRGGEKSKDKRGRRGGKIRGET